jgi:ribA/ribD-fused uncharacterized protein
MEVSKVAAYIKAQIEKGTPESKLLDKLVKKFPKKDLLDLQTRLDRVLSKSKSKSSKTKAPKTKALQKAKLPKKIFYGLPETATEGYGWLSNMAPAVIYAYVGKRYSTDGFLTFVNVEQAFQWIKVDDKKRNVIINCLKPKDAKYHGSEKAGAVMREDWHDIREEVMYQILLAKYSQHLVIRKNLIETEKVPLTEVAPWDKEKFWGVDKNLEGKNMQAKLTEKVRKYLIKNPNSSFVTLDFTTWL